MGTYHPEKVQTDFLRQVENITMKILHSLKIFLTKLRDPETY